MATETTHAADALAGIKVIDVDTHLSEPADLWTRSRAQLAGGARRTHPPPRPPTPALPDDERVVHAVAAQLVHSGHVDKATYDAARAVLGDRGVVELVTLCGYYTLVSFSLNAFDVELPPGETPTWPAAGA